MAPHLRIGTSAMDKDDLALLSIEFARSFPFDREFHAKTNLSYCNPTTLAMASSLALFGKLLWPGTVVNLGAAYSRMILAIS